MELSCSFHCLNCFCVAMNEASARQGHNKEMLRVLTFVRSNALGEETVFPRVVTHVMDFSCAGSGLVLVPRIKLIKSAHVEGGFERKIQSSDVKMFFWKG